MPILSVSSCQYMYASLSDFFRQLCPELRTMFHMLDQLCLELDRMVGQLCLEAVSNVRNGNAVFVGGCIQIGAVCSGRLQWPSPELGFASLDFPEALLSLPPPLLSLSLHGHRAQPRDSGPTTNHQKSDLSASGSLSLTVESK